MNSGIAGMLLLSATVSLHGASSIDRPGGLPSPETQKAPRTVSAETLTLDQALELAERFNPQLRAARASVDGAQAGIVTAKAYSNPTISFGSLGHQQAVHISGIPGMMHGLTLNQNVELPSVRGSRIRAAEIGHQSTRHVYDGTRLNVRSAVKRSFYEAMRHTRMVQVAQETLNLLEDLSRRIRVQVEVGEAARLELTRAEAEVASARIQVRSGELRLSASMSELYAAVGAPLGEDVELSAPLNSRTSLPPLEDLRNEIMTRHPELALAESERQRASANLQTEKALRVPQPSVWMDWLSQPDVAQYRFGVTVTLPVWNRREGPIAEAVATRRRADAMAEQRRVELLAALERSWNMYQVANQQVAIFEEGTLRHAEAAVQAAQAAFRFGERGIIEVLDAQRVLRSARQDYLNAQFDRQAALIDLEQLRATDLVGGRP